MSWVVSTPNATLPITLTEAKLYLKVDTSADDDLITHLITAAKVAAENYLDRYLYDTTITEYYDAFPVSQANNTSAYLYLSVGGVSSVTSITYTDADGNTGTTLASSKYVLDKDINPPRIALAYGQTWPGTYSEIKAVTTTYVVGYGASAGDEPTIVKQAIKMMLSAWYHNRQDSVRRMPTASEYFLNQERLNWY
jgi:uncharacterized phiE125 gp8 family phage protein